jgi:ferredoxin
MRVREIESRRAQKISSSAMLSEAADRMKTLDISRLSVVENNEIVGTITDRGIDTAVSAGMNPTTTPVKYVMIPGAAHDSQEKEIGKAVEITEDRQCKENAMKARVTEDCISCGRCVEICPEVFEMGEDMAHVKLAEIPEQYQDATREAADECPTSAILVEP